MARIPVKVEHDTQIFSSPLKSLYVASKLIISGKRGFFLKKGSMNKCLNLARRIYNRVPLILLANPSILSFSPEKRSFFFTSHGRFNVGFAHSTKDLTVCIT